MTTVITKSRTRFYQQLFDAFEAKLPEAQLPALKAFSRRFFDPVPLAEFSGRRFDDLYGTTLACWKFIQQLQPDSFNVEMFNPELEQHGWQSTHTIVQVLLPNRPFLVDTLRMLMNRHELTIHFVHSLVTEVRRSADGKLEKLVPLEEQDPCGQPEVLIYLEIDRLNDQAALAQVAEELREVLTLLNAITNDFVAMRERVDSLVRDMEDHPPPASQEEVAETLAFLNWLKGNHFTFLGYDEYEFVESDKMPLFRQVEGSPLGVLKTQQERKPEISLSELPSRARNRLLSPELLTFAKSSQLSRIHRPAYPDYISVKRFSSNGKIVGECRFLGLYTAAVYYQELEDIPELRRKKQAVLKRAEEEAHGYNLREIEQILQVYPRDELFQVTVDELYHVVMAIHNIQERRQIRLFMREDTYGQFVNCLLYVPRDIYNTSLRRKAEKILCEALDAQDIGFTTYFSESVLARTQFIIRVPPVEGRRLRERELEQKIVAIAQSWQDGLQEALYEAYAEEQANGFLHNYQFAFSVSYQERFKPRRAVVDIGHMAELEDGRPLAMSLYRMLEEDEHVMHFKLFHPGERLPLSDVLPIFENLGLRVIGEHPFRTVDRKGKVVWIHDFLTESASGTSIDIQKISNIFQEIFTRVWYGEAGNDSFNRLATNAYLSWREVAMLRGYARYMRQIRVNHSQQFIADTLVKHIEVTRLIQQIFMLRFDPASGHSLLKRHTVEEGLVQSFNKALDNVDNLSEDRILRLYLSLIQATLRTNYFQPDREGNTKSYIAFKIESSRVPDMPRPVPRFEVFVFSARVEGVHLRGGRVARGGLRWSDRREDFRTEVLGLVKAQQVKNAVIVPVGAKGGFYPKRLPTGGSRDQVMAEGIACYKTFISGLLDITDNLVEGEVAPPRAVVRHDADDPYLVVAADKGTATFSDIANGIAAEYGFWLGDAFASGGSQGYDHKGMGITARGAWVSVQRHFRERQLNIQETDFTAVGIGDMSGDVFGNGMLLSKHTRLVAAFNHLHIFIDPDPDAASSYEERQRLFGLPRSSWSDYDRELISQGGGVFSRSAKSIPLTPEMQALLDVSDDQLTPNQMIVALLKCQVDLLWIGGIGTYVKAASESHGDVGDKSNDAVRINAEDLRCQVIGEGGNLGVTQLGRVAFDLQGGAVFTDFIDNSAGVDCSDHEVNIKILLNQIVRDGDMTDKQRNQLLADMTDDVAQLVLLNNYRQTQMISLAYREATLRIGEYRRLIDTLESSGKLSRTLEYIPDDETLLERQSQDRGLTRPELSVLIAYVKADLKQQLTDESVVQDGYIAKEVRTAFPQRICREFGKQMLDHRLHPEIIATQVANDMVNHMGITFVSRLVQSTGVSAPAIARAYVVARDMFRLQDWWQAIEALDYQVPSTLQQEMMAEFMGLIRRATRWLLRNRRGQFNCREQVARFSEGIDEVCKHLGSALQGPALEDWQKRRETLMEAGVPEQLADVVAGSRYLYSALGIIEAQETSSMALEQVARIFFAVGAHLDLDWVMQRINEATPRTQWQAMAREAFREDLDWQQRAITIGVLRMKNAPPDTAQRLAVWSDYHQELLSRWHTMVTELKATSVPEFAMYSVALRELLDLAQSATHA